MQVRVIDRAAELGALEPAWDRLCAQDADADPFATVDWLREWWRSFGEHGAQARLPLREGAAADPLAVRDAALSVLAIGEPERPAAVLPLLRIEARWHGRRLRVLAPALNAHAPRSGVAVRGAVAPASEALLDHLCADPGWDVWLLDGIARSSPALSRLVQGARARGLRCAAAPAWSHSFLPLGGTWSEYLQARGRHFRKHLWQAERALARLGPLELRVRSAPAEVESALRELLGIDADSWKAERGESIGAHAALGAHYAAVARAFAAKGACEVWSLAVGGEPAAACLCLVHGQTLYTLKTSYRRRFGSAALSPGAVLFAGILEDAMQRKRAALDFVGRTPFSERFTERATEFGAIAVFRSRAIELACRSRSWLAGVGRSLVRRLTPRAVQHRHGEVS